MTTSADPPAYINAEDLFSWNIYAYENTLKFMRDTSDIASVANLPVIDDSHPTIIFRHDGVEGSRQKYLFVGWKFDDKIISRSDWCLTLLISIDTLYYWEHLKDHIKREGATQYMVLNGIEDYNSASLSHEKWKKGVRGLAASMHLMYEWENERHIPATWASDGEEICHYDSRLSTNNSSLSFAYPTIPLWILGLCSWVPTMYQNGTVYGREGEEYLPKDANKHLPSRKFLSTFPLTIFWNSSPTHSNRQDALILVDRNISVTPNHGPEKISERFGMCCKCGRTDSNSNSEAKEKSTKADGNAKEKNVCLLVFSPVSMTFPLLTAVLIYGRSFEGCSESDSRLFMLTLYHKRLGCGQVTFILRPPVPTLSCNMRLPISPKM
ncbi:hypothetical protein C345_02432 [Cryptococcus neoformans A2-102-5]|nr:hypothetical protein C345_02432 [Cryptococcus neoformans var. grubii A2-102-5]